MYSTQPGRDRGGSIGTTIRRKTDEAEGWPSALTTKRRSLGMISKHSQKSRSQIKRANSFKVLRIPKTCLRDNPISEFVLLACGCAPRYADISKGAGKHAPIHFDPAPRSWLTDGISLVRNRLPSVDDILLRTSLNQGTSGRYDESIPY